MKLFNNSLPILFAALLLLLVAQGISGALSMLSFERRQMDTVISSYEAVGFNLRDDIERSLFLGKPLANFIGIKPVLAKAKKNSEDLVNIGVLDWNGKAIYSLDSDGLAVPGDLLLRLGKEKFGNSRHVQVDKTHYLLFSLKDDDAKIQGYLLFSFDDNTLAAKREAIADKCSLTLLVCSFFAVLLLVTGFEIVRKRWKGLQAKPLMWLVIMVLGLSQVVTNYYNIRFFKADYLSLLQVKAKTTTTLLAEDIETLLHKGLRLTTLFNIEKQLGGVVDSVPEIAGLAILDNNNKALYHQGEPFVSTSDGLRLALKGRNGAKGFLCMKMNRRVVARAIREIALDSVTIVLLSMLFGVELLGFLLSMMQGRESFRVAAQSRELGADTGMVRAAAFLYIFAASLSISFIPLHMAALYQPVPGFSKEMILGLPLALEMLGGGLILIPAGAWIDRRGWHHPFVTGVLLSLAGAVWSGLAVNHFHFMGARLLAGLGYGLGWMSVQGFVIQNTPLNQRARGISSIVAGIFAGIICGNGMGALIAQRLGFGRVFLMGGMGMGVVLLLVLICLRSTFAVPKTIPDRTGSIHSFLRLLRDPQALLIFICSLVPYSIVMVGLLYYITPLFLSGAGVSQSDIGRVIMLFGLGMIFIAPQVSRLADKLRDKRLLVIGGGIIGSGSLLLFYFSESFWIVVASVFFFGLSVSISGASRNIMTLNLPVAQQIGSSRVMGIYRSIDKLGQMLGALVPAALMAWFSIPDTMLVMGCVYLLLTLILIVCLTPRQAGQPENRGPGPGRRKWLR